MKKIIAVAALLCIGFAVGQTAPALKFPYLSAKSNAETTITAVERSCLSRRFVTAEKFQCGSGALLCKEVTCVPAPQYIEVTAVVGLAPSYQEVHIRQTVLRQAAESIESKWLTYAHTPGVTDLTNRTPHVILIKNEEGKELARRAADGTITTALDAPSGGAAGR